MEGKSRHSVGSSHYSIDSGREGVETRQNPPKYEGREAGVPETVWRDFISSGEYLVFLQASTPGIVVL